MCKCYTLKALEEQHVLNRSCHKINWVMRDDKATTVSAGNVQGNCEVISTMQWCARTKQRMTSEAERMTCLLSLKSCIFFHFSCRSWNHLCYKANYRQNSLRKIRLRQIRKCRGTSGTKWSFPANQDSERGIFFRTTSVALEEANRMIDQSPSQTRS